MVLQPETASTEISSNIVISHFLGPRLGREILISFAIPFNGALRASDWKAFVISGPFQLVGIVILSDTAAHGHHRS